MDFSTATLCFNCIKPFMGRAAGSGELAWQEGERGQLSPRPLPCAVSQTAAALRGLAGKIQSCGYTIHPMEDLAQGCPNDLNCVFLHCGIYLLRGHNKTVFKSTQVRKQSLPGNTVAAPKHLGVQALEQKNKKQKTHSYLSQRAMQCWHVSKRA